MKKIKHRNRLIYQIYPLSFCDSNNDGKGDIKGIISKLDHLKDLGVTDIWISPIYETNFTDHGYDIKNYYEIDAIFGSMKDFKKLVREGRKRKIGIAMDMVMEYTSTDNIWFKKSSLKESKYKEYYIWRDKPSNMYSQFEDSAWSFNKDRKQFFFHHFGRFQADLNWDNPDVMKEFIKIIKFWIRKGVRGFRFDVIDMLGKDVDNNKIINIELAYKRIRELGSKTWLRDKYIFTVGEAWSTNTNDAKKHINKIDGVFTTHFHGSYIFNGWEKSRWEPKKTNKKWFIEFKSNIFEKWKGAKKEIILPIFLENHDLPRAIDRWLPNTLNHQKRAKILLFSFYGLPGIPFIYQGQEFGIGNPIFKNIDSFQDPETKKYIRNNENKISKNRLFKNACIGSRDNGRGMLPWEKVITKKNNWIKDAKYDINFSEIKAMKNNIYDLYKKIIGVRKKYSDLFNSGEVTPIMERDENLFSYVIHNDKISLCFVANWGDKHVDIDLSEYTEVYSEGRSSKGLVGYGIYLGKKEKS